MNLADTINPLTLRIDLAQFEPHAICIPRACDLPRPLTAVPSPQRKENEDRHKADIRAALRGEHVSRTLDSLSEAIGVSYSYVADLAKGMLQAGEIERSTHHKPYRYSLRRKP